MKDGWHKVYGWDVLVEDGKVVRGLNSKGDLPLYPYVCSPYGGWDLCQYLSLVAFRKRVARGTAKMH